MNAAQDPGKKEIIKRRHFAFRLNVFFFAVFVLFSILIVRLAILQFVEGAELKAMKNSTSVFPYDIPPIRGNIYDRNGYPIAVSTSTQTLYYQYDMGQSPDEVIRLARELERIFAEYGTEKGRMTAAEIVDAMDVGYDINKKQKTIMDRLSSPRRIKNDLTDREIAYILEHRDEFKNIDIVEESVREYATETVVDDEKTGIAAQLVGYLRQYSTAINHIEYYRDTPDKYLMTENVGFDGIELMYERQLRGQSGRKTYPINAVGQIIGEPVITPPTMGNHLYLTIDKDVQLAAEKAVRDHLEVLRTDPVYRKVNSKGVNALTGYVVAMEVDTGKVVAMVSYPDYDPNVWRNGRISPENYEKIQYVYRNGTIQDVPPNVMDDKERGRLPTSFVPLGSTMKPLTVLIGLNEKVISTDTVYNDRGVFYYGRDNSKISNSNSVSYGNMDPTRAIAVSSNTFMAEKVGIPLYNKYGGDKVLDVWDSYVTQFGLGVTTGSGLPGEHPGIKEYYSMAKNSSTQAAMVFSSFGQGARYTTLQLAQYAATLANRGKRPKPQFVEKIETYDGKTVQQFEPVFLNTVEFPDAYWDEVEAGMLQVGVQGFEGFPYTVARKTGTSESDVAAQRLENAVFIAYAPAEKPKLAVAVVVPNGGYGAWGAGPIARKVFDAYDAAYGLAQKSEDTP
mgnify:FL=1